MSDPIVVGGKVYKNAITFDQAYDRLAQSKRQVRDMTCPLTDWRPVVNRDGAFALENKSGAQYVPTDHALSQMAVVGGNQGGGFLKALRRNVVATNKEKTNGITRDRGDSELMVRILQNTLFHKDRVDQTKDRFFRTWSDGTMRALLSTQYAVVNSEWYLDVLRDTIPTGVFTRWNGDADTLRADLLVPDTVRKADDSDYGGQVHIGNSEIGNRRVISACSIFRLVCTNGMIAAKSLGEGTRKVHRGDLDLETLRITITSNIKDQLKIMDNQIYNLLGMKAYGVGDVSMPLVFAQLAKQYKLGRNVMPKILDAYATEGELVGIKHINSAFGAIQAITRQAQNMADPMDMESMEIVAGQIAAMPRPKWDSLVGMAGKLGKADLESVYGEALATAIAA